MQYIIPIVFAIIGTLLVIVPPVVFLSKAFRKFSKEDAIRSNGIRTTAVIKKIELHHDERGNELSPGVRLSVLMENEKGEASSAQIDTTIAVTDIPQFQPGTKIDVAYDPADPTKAVLLSDSYDDQG